MGSGCYIDDGENVGTDTGETSGYDGVLTTLDPNISSGEAMAQSSNDMTYLLSNNAWQFS